MVYIVDNSYPRKPYNKDNWVAKVYKRCLSKEIIINRFIRIWSISKVAKCNIPVKTSMDFIWQLTAMAISVIKLEHNHIKNKLTVLSHQHKQTVQFIWHLLLYFKSKITAADSQNFKSNWQGKMSLQKLILHSDKTIGYRYIAQTKITSN